MSVASLQTQAHAPPQSAAEALSSLLWQPYECRSPSLARSATDGFLWRGGRGEPSPLQPHASCARAPQSPSGGRHACAWIRATTLRHDMRLPVPGPGAPAPKCDAVSVRVPGEPSAPNVSSVHIVPEPDTVNCNVNSAVQTERERNVASAECQTEEPTRRHRTRRARLARCAPLGVPVSAVGTGSVFDPLEGNVPPPPYSTLPLPPPPPALLAGPPPAVIAAVPPPAHRFPFQPIPLRRSGRGAAYTCSDEDGAAPKSCCGRPPLRLCVLFLGVVGACLVAAGAVLGALRPHPRATLTLLLLMIGVGVVLVTAAGLAWRLGSRDAPCVLLGLRRASCRTLVPRLPPSYARPHHPYAAMLYPEFHYRPPPPTYQASMQEYRLRLLLLDRSAPAISPPPTYRSNTASLVRSAGVATWCSSEYSGPPSYRAPRPEPTVTVDNLPSLTPIELKYGDDVLESPANEHKDRDEHLVTIVQTDDQPVIVTVSGSTTLNDSHMQPSSEIDILAHL